MNSFSLSDTLISERNRWVLWLPVFIGVGIAVYFSLGEEPHLRVGLALFFAALGGTMAARRWKILQMILVALALASLGFAAAQWRTQWVEAPVLHDSLDFAHVEGTVSELAASPKGMKLTLADVDIEELKREHTPKKVSLSFRKYDENLHTGQRIYVLAGLFPPPEPAVPGGFDFSRYFYFRQVGANGYGLKYQIVQEKPESGFGLWLSDARHRLTERIRGGMHAPEGAIAAALVTGETRAIPESVNENMRVAGIYHLLAVSGMNLAIVSGLIFFLSRFLLALIPYVALRHDIKKMAAVLSLLGSFFYLLITDAPVSAERAFVMVAFLFAAILLGREVHPMRSLMFAAALILLVQPESIAGAGFQLSFAATLGLVAFYESLRGRWMLEGDAKGWKRRAQFYIFGLLWSPFVAGLFTAPLIINDFQQVSTYTLLANMLVDPLVTFVMMPAVLLGLALMPLHLEAIAFAPLQWSITIMLQLAEWINQLPHAQFHTPTLTGWGLACVVLGGLWLTLWQTRWRYAGLELVALGMASMAAFTTPDLLVSGDGKAAAAKLAPDTWYLVRGKESGFVAEQWMQYLAVDTFAQEPGGPLTCDDDGCVYKKDGRRVVFADTLDAMGKWCDAAEMVVPGKKQDASICPAAAWKRNQAGNIAVTVEAGGLRVVTVREMQGRRPWVK